MKRDKIRRHTDESLKKICKQYRTRSELQLNDPSAYSCSLSRGHDFLNEACAHMLKVNSTPQLICKLIMEKLLGSKCMYNTRKIIKPYELDIYFPKFKFALEYNGRGWHSKPDVIERDKEKAKMCKKMGITLLVFDQETANYEVEIKKLIIENLSLISSICEVEIAAEAVESIDCSSVFDDIINFKNPDGIKNKIISCKNIAEFQRKFPNEYFYLRHSSSFELLEEIRERYEMPLEELREKCLEISCYSDFLSNHSQLYQKCYKRGVLREFTAHMQRKPKARHASFSNLELVEKARELSPIYKTDIFYKNRSLYIEIEKRGIPWDSCLISKEACRSEI